MINECDILSFVVALVWVSIGYYLYKKDVKRFLEELDEIRREMRV